jgi:hypothetical protein
MCCRITVTSVNDQTAHYLRIAGFVPEGFGSWWSRDIPAEAATVRARVSESRVELSLYPPIDSRRDHNHKRLSASFMFQLAALLAEKAGATVFQEARVEACVIGDSPTVLVASYPEQPLQVEAICPGFRELLGFLPRPSA